MITQQLQHSQEVLDHFIQPVCIGVLICLKREEKPSHIIRLCSDVRPLNVTLEDLQKRMHIHVNEIIVHSFRNPQVRQVVFK